MNQAYESTVLIAGAGSGIGRSVARTVARSGRRVVLLARDAARLGKVAEEIRAAGGRADVVAGDASEPDVAREAAARAAELSLEALVNCVGANIPQRALTELSDDGWTQVLRVNLEAAYQLTRAVLPHFRDRQHGLLVHLASRATLAPDASGVAYQAAKAGVTALAHATHVEEKENGIRVSVVYPGLTNTPMVYQRAVPPSAAQLESALDPDDVAAAVQLLIELPERAHVPDLGIFPTH